MNPSSDVTSLDAPHFLNTPRTKWEREFLAFRRLLPELLNTDKNMFVAVHDEQVVDRDQDELALILRTLSMVGNIDIHVGKVSD